MNLRAPSRRWALAAVAGAALLICTNGPVFFAGRLAGKPQGAWEDPRVRIPFLAAAACGVLLLVVDRPTIRDLRPRWPLFATGAYVALALASAAWSPVPSVTFKRAVIYVGLGALALWLAQRPFRVQVTVIAGAMAVATTASVLTVWLWPEVGLMVADGYFLGWKGIFTNRNSLAPVAALGLLAVFAIVADGRTTWRARLPWLAVATIEVVALAGSRSDTSKVALALAMIGGGATWLLARLLSGRAAVVLAGIVTAGIAFAAATRPRPVLAAITRAAGRSSTLSSRTLIWEDVVDEIGRRPVLGHGHFTFWDIPQWTQDLYAHVGSAYGEAHNSLLEVALGLGVVGATLFVAILLAALAGNLRGYWQDRSLATWWWSTATLYFLLVNVTESFVLWFSYNWVLLMVAALVPSCARRAQATASARRLSRSFGR
jgi:O-antigen ligase